MPAKVFLLCAVGLFLLGSANILLGAYKQIYGLHNDEALHSEFPTDSAKALSITSLDREEPAPLELKKKVHKKVVRSNYYRVVTHGGGIFFSLGLFFTALSILTFGIRRERREA